MDTNDFNYGQTVSVLFVEVVSWCELTLLDLSGFLPVG